MKILFYDIKEAEYIYFNENLENDFTAYYESSRLDENTQIKDEYKDIEGLSTFVGSILNSEVLKKFPNLKFIYLRSTGYSNVDIQYCKQKNIRIFNVPNYGTTTVAEFVFALILSAAKKINIANRKLIGGEINKDDLIGFELLNKVLGIIGMGSIGKKTAEIAKSFNMEVLAYDIKTDNNYNYVELDELLKYSDFISINCPLTEKTKGLINANTLNKMKKSAFLINTARGEIVNIEDLYKALVEGKIQGAALDVIECEESLCALFNLCHTHKTLEELCVKKYLFIQKLFTLPNVIITPHIAYNTVEANKRISETTLLNIKKSLNVNSDTKNLVF